MPRRRITAQTNTYAYATEITQILPHLYLSSLSAARSESCSNLVNLGITHIITVLDYKVQFKGWSGERLVIKLQDGFCTDLLGRLDECVEFVQKARDQGGKVLVHCKMGLSRSVSVVAACLVVELGVSATEAMKRIKQKRGTVKPNGGFVEQLKEFERRVCSNAKEGDCLTE